MFAYVRLCSLNGRKNVEKPNGECPEATEDVKKGRRKNAECRMKSRAAEIATCTT
jgi:hypothetical protein